VGPARRGRRLLTGAKLNTNLQIRDRYILARFPGVMRSSEDLVDAGEVIKAARIYFEDNLAVRGLELLQFATEVDPSREAPWLAHLQMLFMLRDAPAFAATAGRMHHHHSQSKHWTQIAELGRNLALDDGFFAQIGVQPGPAAQAGAWPELPDWLDTRRDLTPEVAAAEMRAHLLAATERRQPGLKESA
jgi:hypothetical protein